MPGGWSSSDRRRRLPKDWHAQRARTYRAAGGRCQQVTNGTRCTWHGPLNRTNGQPGGHCDHINREAGDASPLQWLCPTHHLAKSSAEGNQAQRATRSASKHTPEHHPGLR